MAARGTKRALDEPPVEEPEVEEPESSEESGDEPFAEGPASDLFSPSKEQAKSKPNLPQRVAYIDRPIMIAGELHETAVLCSLPHARAGKAQYIVQKGAVLEIHRVRRDPGSWFASDAVIEDGSLYLATEVDPLFVMIPILEKSRKKGFFTPLSQIISEDEQFSAGLQHAFNLGLLSSVHVICDTRTVGDEKLFRLSDQKLLAWLEVKVLKLSTRLMGMDSTMSQSSAVASNVNLTHKDMTSEEASAAAIGLLSEYVSVDWLRRVYTSLGFGCAAFAPLSSSSIPEPTAAKPPSAYLTVEPKQYRRASEKESVAKPKSPVAIRRLENVDKRGMSAITSFFKPKPKPT